MRPFLFLLLLALGSDGGETGRTADFQGVSQGGFAGRRSAATVVAGIAPIREVPPQQEVTRVGERRNFGQDQESQSSRAEMLPLAAAWTTGGDDGDNSVAFDDGGMSDYKPVVRDGDRSGQQPYVGYGDDDGDGTRVVALDDAEEPNWKWCLLTIDGNATIIQNRRDAFIRYFRMNLASLVGTDFDSVIFNSVSYVPEILVNVSLDWRASRAEKIVSVLGDLAKHNDTLLDLSGEHFNVTNFVPWSAILAPKPVAPLENGGVDPKEVEALVFTAVGAAIVFLLLASLTFAVCRCSRNRRMAAVNKAKSEANGGRTLRRGDQQLRRSESSTGYLLANSSHYSLDHMDSGSSTDGGSSRPRSGLQHHQQYQQQLQQQQQNPYYQRGSHHPRVIYSQSFSDGLTNHQMQYYNGRIPPQRRHTGLPPPMEEETTTAVLSAAPLATFTNGEEDDVEVVDFTQSPPPPPMARPTSATMPHPHHQHPHRRKQRRFVVPPPASDSQSDIIVCAPPTGDGAAADGRVDEEALALLDAERPFSVQSCRSATMRHPHHHHRHSQPHHFPAHRNSRGGFLPMAPVFQTASVDASSGAENGSAVATPTPPAIPAANGTPTASSSRSTTPRHAARVPNSRSYHGPDDDHYVAELPPHLRRYRSPPPPMTSFRRGPPSKAEIERDVQIVLHNMGIEEQQQLQQQQQQQQQLANGNVE